MRQALKEITQSKPEQPSSNKIFSKGPLWGHYDLWYLLMGSALDVSWHCLCLSLGARPVVWKFLCTYGQGGQTTPAPPQLHGAHKNRNRELLHWLLQILILLLELLLHGSESGKQKNPQKILKKILEFNIQKRVEEYLCLQLLHSLPGPPLFWTVLHPTLSTGFPHLCILCYTHFTLLKYPPDTKSQKDLGLPDTRRFINTFNEWTLPLSQKSPPQSKTKSRMLAQKKHDSGKFRLQPVSSGNTYAYRLPPVPNYLPNWWIN